MAGATGHRAVQVEADGGSRGNPGPAAYGAVLLDADTREVVAERAERIGTATNNVAEYSGLIAGLELHREHTPEAELEVRMDSKLVVEQMSGRWRVKHPSMVPLAERARGLAPAGTRFTWIPREQNRHADRILNEALDGHATSAVSSVAAAAPAQHSSPTQSSSQTRSSAPAPGWADSPTTTLLLVRHGVTAHTVDKLFSGGLGGSNPGLTDEGRDQVRATAEWLTPLAEELDVVVSSPVRRTRETAEIIGARLGLEVSGEDGLAEMEFGSWDGLSFAEIRERFPDDLDRWLGSPEVAPGGHGESLAVVQGRVLAGLERLLAEHAGRSIVAVSHVTPIKVLVAHALGAPLDSVFRMELAPASVSVLSFYADGLASLRSFNLRPVDGAVTAG